MNKGPMTPTMNPSPKRSRRAAQPLELILWNPLGQANCIGIEEVPGRLPQVLRLPGESFEQMTRRAVASATGSGVLLARLKYAEVRQ